MTKQYKIFFLSTIVLVWFVFGTILIINSSIDKSKLKTISGELEFYDIVKILGSKQIIDVMVLKVKGHDDKVALYLNSEKEYLPLFEKFKIIQPITVIYNDKDDVTSDGHNLHIYEITYGKEIIIDYNEKANTAKAVAIILYITGLICCIPLIYVIRQKSIW